MKRFFFLLIAAALLFSACSAARKVSASEDVSPWVGCETLDIIQAMGNPVRIDTDRKGGSVLVYESLPDYDDPDFDILDPEISARKRQYAYFYLNDEGVCYHVDTNRALPATPGRIYKNGHWAVALEWLLIVPMFLLVELL